MEHGSDNYYILTGGPGAGKTSVLEELARQGYSTIAEVARQIIKEQIRIGGDALHTGDQEKYRDLMLSRSLLTWDQAANLPGPVFFDRGLPELVGYGVPTGEAAPDYIRRAAELHRYNRRVFLFPPWQEIYTHDEERNHDFSHAVRVNEETRTCYTACGYACIDVPKASIEERVTFILDRVTRVSGQKRGAEGQS